MYTLQPCERGLIIKTRDTDVMLSCELFVQAKLLNRVLHLQCLLLCTLHLGLVPKAYHVLMSLGYFLHCSNMIYRNQSQYFLKFLKKVIFNALLLFQQMGHNILTDLSNNSSVLIRHNAF